MLSGILSGEFLSAGLGGIMLAISAVLLIAFIAVGFILSYHWRKYELQSRGASFRLIYLAVGLTLLVVMAIAQIIYHD